MNLLLPIEHLAKHIMSASALFLKLRALSALWMEDARTQQKMFWSDVEFYYLKQ